MRLFQIVLAVAALGAASGCGSNSGSKLPTLLPDTGEALGWTKTGETRTFQADNLWEYIDGDAERYVQAGVERTLTADYRYQDKAEATADIYVMKASEGARKIYDAESSVGSQPVQLGDAARLFASSVVFRKGPYLVRLTAFQEAPQIGQALTELARAVERRLSK